MVVAKASMSEALAHLRANTDNIDPILPLGNLLPQRQTRINANGAILTRPYRPFLIDLRSLALICGCIFSEVPARSMFPVVESICTSTGKRKLESHFMVEPFGWSDQAAPSRPDEERRRFGWPPNPSFRQGMPEPAGAREGRLTGPFKAGCIHQGLLNSSRCRPWTAGFRGPTRNDGVAVNARPVGRGEPVDRVRPDKDSIRTFAYLY